MIKTVPASVQRFCVSPSARQQTLIRMFNVWAQDLSNTKGGALLLMLLINTRWSGILVRAQPGPLTCRCPVIMHHMASFDASAIDSMLAQVPCLCTVLLFSKSLHLLLSSESGCHLGRSSHPDWLQLLQTSSLWSLPESCEDAHSTGLL